MGFFKSEIIQCPVFCLSNCKGGRSPSTLLRAVSLSNGASSKLTTKEGCLYTRNFAARLTTSLCWFHADYFFATKKKKVPCGTSTTSFTIKNINSYDIEAK